MRRDLAVYRNTRDNQESDTRSEQQMKDVAGHENLKLESGVVESAGDVDVNMTGDSPTTLEHSPPQDASKQTSDTAATAPSTAEKATLPASSDPAVSEPYVTAPAVPQEPIHIEIPAGDHSGSDNPTDAATGTYSNFDFESLFNDPSAQASPNAQPAQDPEPAATKPQTETNQQSNPVPAPKQTSPKQSPAKPTETRQEPDDLFDFGDLSQFDTANNNTDLQGEDGDDNISSLLPGLESYANATPTNDQQTNNPNSADATGIPNNTNVFDIFDAAVAPDLNAPSLSATNDMNPMNIDSQTNNMLNQGQQQQQLGQMSMLEGGDGAERNDNFDVLMNFDNFDMGSFVGGDDDDENGGGTGAFDASFFDV